MVIINNSALAVSVCDGFLLTLALWVINVPGDLPFGNLIFGEILLAISFMLIIVVVIGINKERVFSEKEDK